MNTNPSDEQNRGLEDEFLKSWDGVEQNFREMNLPDTAKILALIAAMRQRGYDRIFRAGTSLYSLVLSRSREYGLHDSQPRVTFDFFRGTPMEVYAVRQSRRKGSRRKLEFTAEIDAWLKELAAEPIS